MYRIPSTAGYFPADALFLDIFLGGSPEGKVVHPTTEEDLTDGWKFKTLHRFGVTEIGMSRNVGSLLQVFLANF